MILIDEHILKNTHAASRFLVVVEEVRGAMRNQPQGAPSLFTSIMSNDVITRKLRGYFSLPSTKLKAERASEEHVREGTSQGFAIIDQ